MSACRISSRAKTRVSCAACLAWRGSVAPGARLGDEGFGFVFDDFELCDISIEFACILAY